MAWWDNDPPAQQSAPAKANWWDVDEDAVANARPEIAQPSMMKGGKGPAERFEDQEIDRGVMESQLNAPFDFNKGVKGFGTRFDLARSTNPDERVLKLKSKYPDADARVVRNAQGENMVAVKLPGENVFHGIDEEGVSAGDVADVAADVINPATIASLFATYLTRNPETGAAVNTGINALRGANVGTRMAVQTGAGAAGSLADSGVEAARGYQTDPLDEVFAQAGTTGVATGAGEGLGSLVSKIINTFRGGGLIDPLPGVKAAKTAAEEEGLPPLTLGQQHPTAARRENQLAMTSQVPKGYYLKQEGALADKLIGKADELAQSPGTPPSPDFVGPMPNVKQPITDADLENTVMSMAKEIEGSLKIPNTTLERGGQALQDTREGFKQKSGEWVDNKYKNAIAAGEDATFDITPLQQLAAESRKGVQMKAKDVVSADGAGDLPIITPGKGVNVAGAPKGDLAGIMDAVQQLDPNVGSFRGTSGFEQLKTLRSRLGDYIGQDFQKLTPEQRQEYRMAKNMYAALTDVIQNPAGGSPEFKQMWTAANKANRFREGVLGAQDVQRLAKSENPADLMRFAAPGEATSLRLFKRMADPQKWQQFTNGFKTKLMAEPEKINAQLDAFKKDPTSLDLLLSKAEQNELRTYGGAAQKLNSGTVMKALKSQTDTAGKVSQILDNGTEAELSDLIKRNGGPDTPFGKNMRAAVFESIFDKSSRLAKGSDRPTIDPQQFVKVVSDYVDSGRLKGVLTPSDIETLTRLRAYGNQVPMPADAGSSMQAAGLAKVWEWIIPSQTIKSGMGVGFNAIQARTFTNPKVTKYLTSGTKGLKPITSLRGGAALLSTVAAEMANDEPQAKENDDRR